jgi:hypothetical protein
LSKPLFYFLAFLILLPISANANSSIPNEEELLAQAKSKRLAESKQWLSLLHYNRGGTLHSRKQSYVVSRNFFLSETGHNNPKAELEENIRQLFFENIENRCQFPARYHWLSKNLGIKNHTEGLQHCELFLKVQKQVAAKKIVLVFPSAYMNSASSIFGHTLLRIDTSEKDESVILNWAINYGAKLNENDNALQYAAKGLSGLYKGQYFVVPYAQKIKEYGQIENRDIWEYPLDLKQSEINFLLEHLWELKDIDFDYYFLDENCSYRLLELLEVAKPELELTNELRLTEIPINTVKILEENQLIKGEVYRPSKETRLKTRFKLLEKEQVRLSKKLSSTKESLETLETNQAFNKLKKEQKSGVLEGAYEYLRFQQSQKKRDSTSAKRSLALLKSINKLSLEHNISREQPEIETPVSILQTHDSHRIKLGAGKIEDQHGYQHNYQHLQYRMAYHDLLDNSPGYLSGAHIEGPSLGVKNSDYKTLIDSWQLVDIISLNPLSALRKDLSWNISIGGQRSEEGNAHLGATLQAGGGYTFAYKNWMHFQMLSPRVENNPDYEGNNKAGFEFSTALIYNRGKHPASLNFKHIKLEDLSAKQISQFTQQIELSRNTGLRINLSRFSQKNSSEKEEIDSAELVFLLYF